MASVKHLTVKQIMEAIHKTKGMVTLAAEMLGCSSENIYQRAKTTPAIAEAIARESDRSLDVAELQLIKQINEGNTTALIFYLKTKGKYRGYVERSEVINIPPDIAEILKESETTYSEAQQQWFDMIRAAKAKAKHE